MNCQDVIEILSVDPVPDTLRACAAREHTRTCADCRAALTALRALAAERRVTPPLVDGAFDRALRHAVYSRRTETSRRGFWLGATVGAALAASFAVVATLVWLQAAIPTAAPEHPQVRMALNELRNVSVSLESPQALADAEIHVVLMGAIGLDGFGAQRELRWVTNLERGVNQLTLPLVAIGPNGGQVVVEVVHSTKRTTFVVDVQTVEAAPAAAAPQGTRASAAV
jgi:hypothetical protein